MIKNTYPESIEESGNYLRMTLKNISKYKLPYNPISYLLWYEYATGRNEQLNKDIGTFVEKNTPITMDAIEGLFKNHIADHQVVLAEKKAQKFQSILVEMTQHFSRSGNEIGAQGNVLEACAMELSQSPSLEQITDITERIILETKQIVESCKTLKGRLDSTVSEITTLSKEIEDVKQAAKTDMLTGLLNRRGFHRAMSQLLDNRRTTREPLSVIMLDIDHFKRVNDTYGHLVGDNVLKALSKLLKDSIKGKDIAARFGGEEFILALPQTIIDGAHTVAEQIRTNLQRMKWKIKDSGKSIGPISLSLGVALYRDKESVDTVIKRADDALYHAKNTGRNRTVTEFDLKL
jgi:diguanylate cyclase